MRIFCVQYASPIKVKSVYAQCTLLKCIGSGLPRRYAHKQSMQIGGVQWRASLYSGGLSCRYNGSQITVNSR